MDNGFTDLYTLVTDNNDEDITTLYIRTDIMIIASFLNSTDIEETYSSLINMILILNEFSTSKILQVSSGITKLVDGYISENDNLLKAIECLIDDNSGITDERMLLIIIFRLLKVKSLVSSVKFAPNQNIENYIYYDYVIHFDAFKHNKDRMMTFLKNIYIKRGCGK